jgi:histidine ammonia-lyase
MLNAGIAPIIGSNDQVVTDRCASEQLLRAIHGLGEAEVSVDGVVAVMSIADAFQKASLQAVESFSAKEIVNFLQGQPLTTALTALALNAANLMLDTSDASSFFILCFDPTFLCSIFCSLNRSRCADL